MVDVGETDKNRLGLIVVDAKTTMYGTLSDLGNTREVVHEFVTDRPNRREVIREYQGRGGQSSLVLGRLRVKAFKDHIKKTAEMATQFFINLETGEPNVAWLILSCAPGFKSFLGVRDSLDPRLLAKILNGVGGGPDLSNHLLVKVLNGVSVCEEEMGVDLHLLAKIFDGLSVSYPGAVCGEEMGFDPRLQAKILNENSARVKEWMPFDPRLQAKILNVVGVSCGGEKGFDEAVANISSVYQV